MTVVKIRKILFQDPYYHTIKQDPFQPLTSGKIAARLSFLKEVAEGRYKMENLEQCLCRNDEVDILATTDRYLFPQTVLICPSCGLIMNSPRLDDKSYDLYYKSGLCSETSVSYNRYLTNVPEYVSNPYYKKVLKLVEKSKIRIDKDWNILDIGTGNGSLLYNFLQDGFKNLQGIEPERQACETAKSFGINVHEGTIDDFTPKQPYDLLIFINALNHLNNPLQVLRKLREGFLKPGGLIYIGQIGPLNPREYFWMRTIFRVIKVAHPYNYHVLTLNMLLEASGFKTLAFNESVEGLYRIDPKSKFEIVPSTEAYRAIIKDLENMNELRTKRWYKILKSTYHLWFPIWEKLIETTKKIGLYTLLRGPWRYFLKFFSS